MLGELDSKRHTLWARLIILVVNIIALPFLIAAICMQEYSTQTGMVRNTVIYVSLW